jgi:hypothetical protein
MQARKKVLKKKAAKQQVRKAFIKRKPSSSLEELAKIKMPNWRIAQESVEDSPGAVDVDAISPRLFSAKTAAAPRRLQTAFTNAEGDSGSKSSANKKSGLVNMVPDTDQDARVGAKTQVFEDDEHTGSQG